MLTHGNNLDLRTLRIAYYNVCMTLDHLAEEDAIAVADNILADVDAVLRKRRLIHGQIYWRRRIRCQCPGTVLMYGVHENEAIVAGTRRNIQNHTWIHRTCAF